jgi:hypothetical protein
LERYGPLMPPRFAIPAQSVIEEVETERAAIAKSQAKEPSTFLKSLKYVRLILRPHKGKY